MKPSRPLRLVPPALALGGALLLILPGAREASGYSLGGFNVALSAEAQRDVRVFNNFSDPQTNQNTTIDPQFPGWDGAEEAIWKAAVEWGSEAHGNGSGDPLQPVLGSGGANFDAVWDGEATGIGTSDDNVVSAVTSCGSGVLAYTEIPTKNGWRIRFCDGSWVWYDGPGDNPGTGNDFDLQGVATHEYGHALGLGHSTVPSATMYPSTSSSGSSDFRSIEPDDMAGVQAIYGVIFSSFKPHIGSVTVNGGQVTITGNHFSPTGGEVWFTNRNVSEPLPDPRVRVLGVSSTNGGTQITVAIPADAGPGDVFVKLSRNGNNTLSNGFPFDGTGSGAPLTVSSVTPSTVENLVVGTAQTMTVQGTGFSPTFWIEIDKNKITGASTFVSDTQLSFEWEPIASLGMHTLTVIDGGVSASVGIQVVANATPALQVGDGDPGNVVSGSAMLTLGGQPGDLHYVLASDLAVPSVLPGKLSLGLGSSFQDITPIGLFQVGVDGLATSSVPLGTTSNVTLEWQSLRITLPLTYPIATSNLQSTFTP